MLHANLCKSLKSASSAFYSFTTPTEQAVAVKNLTHNICSSLRYFALLCGKLCVTLRLRAIFRLEYSIAVKKFIMFTLLLSAFLSLQHHAESE
jgi:hypothetical protein